MLKILGIIPLYLLLTGNCLGQVEVSYIDVASPSPGVLSATVFVQNIGPPTTVLSLYGDLWEAAYRRGEFLVSYHYIPRNEYTTRNASSIVIKTILDTYVTMPTPTYELTSTGTKVHEQWEVVYTGVPSRADNVRITILGFTHVVGDMPNAENARLALAGRVDSLVRAADRHESAGEFTEVVSNLETAIQLDSSLAPANLPRVARAQVALADHAHSHENHTLAIRHYQKAVTVNPLILSVCRIPYGLSLQAQADGFANEGQYADASKFYLKALAVDPSLRGVVEERFAGIRKSPIKAALLSFIPGGGQLYNGENKRAAATLGAFAIVAALSYAKYQNAESHYKEYESATDSWSAQSLFDQTEKDQRESQTYGVIAFAIMGWSMIDAYRSSKSFNREFALPDDHSAVTVFPTYSSTGLSLSLRVGF